MKKEFAKDGLFYGLASLISGVSAFFLLPLYTKNLTPQEYGQIDFINVLQVIVQIFVGLEIAQGIARYASTAETKAIEATYISTGLTFLIATSLAAFFVVMSLGFFNAGLLFQAGAGMALSKALLYFFQSQLRWNRRPLQYLIVASVVALTSVGFTWGVIHFCELTVANLLLALSMAQILGICLCVFFLKGTFRLEFKRAPFQKLFRYSFPLVLSSLALFIGSYADRLFLKTYLGFNDLGIYAVAARFSSMIAVGLSGFQMAVAPIVFRFHSLPETPRHLSELLRMFLWGGFAVAMSLSFLGPDLILLFSNEKYLEAGALIPFLAGGVVLNSLYTFVPGLWLKDQTGKFAMINLGVAALSFVLNIFLVPEMGRYGAALSFFGASVGNFALHSYFSHRVFPLPLPHFRIWLAVVVFVGLAVATQSLVFWKLEMRLALIPAAFGLLGFILLRPSEIRGRLKIN